MERRVLTVPDTGDARIDTVVAGELALSRTRVQALIAEGLVTAEGRAVRKSEILPAGARVEVRVPPPEPVGIEPEQLELPIIHEDASLCVVDKPAGMVTHPAPGNRTGTMVNALMHAVGELSDVGGRLRPGIVHRLDKDTSGLLVVAKSDAAHRALQAALIRREISRIYTAASWGRLSTSELEIDAPIGRHPKDRKRMTVLESGRPALTRVRVVEEFRCCELLEVELGSGRTHQIRVHLAHLGHPVVGDPVYGAGRERGFGGPARAWAAELARRTPRQFLHARSLSFSHPETGEVMEFDSPLPDDLARVRRWALEY